ncbi:amino acid ABC transporter permease, partial [Sinorhizobium meliloti]
MSTNQASFVRASMIEASPAPSLESGAVSWLRKNLFATPKDTALTIISLLILAWLVPPAIQWLFIDAAWSGGGRGVCATLSQGGSQPEGWSGACWAFVNAKFAQFLFGRYPLDERWRPALVGILFVLLLVPMLI